MPRRDGQGQKRRGTQQGTVDPRPGTFWSMQPGHEEQHAHRRHADPLEDAQRAGLDPEYALHIPGITQEARATQKSGEIQTAPVQRFRQASGAAARLNHGDSGS